MDINKKFKLTVTTKKVTLEYLNGVDLTTVESKMTIPISDAMPFLADYLYAGVSQTTALLGAFMFDVKWECPQYRWIVPYACIYSWSTDGSTFTTTVPAFATILAAIETAIDTQSEH